MGRLMSKYSYIALAPLYSWPVVHRPIPPGTQQPMVLMVPDRILAPVLTARAKCSPHIHQARSTHSARLTLTHLISLSPSLSLSSPHSHPARSTLTQLVSLALSSSQPHPAHLTLTLTQLAPLSPSSPHLTLTLTQLVPVSLSSEQVGQTLPLPADSTSKPAKLEEVPLPLYGAFTQPFTVVPGAPVFCNSLMSQHG